MISKDILSQVNRWKKDGKAVVLATGVFDLLHIEHIRFLELAKQAGDILVVGIERDRRVKQIKGESRPVNDQMVRLEQLRAIKSVDLVFLLPDKFDEQSDWEEFVKNLAPDVYAVSSHTRWLDNKRELIERYGGRLKVVHEFNPEMSTTKIVEHLCKEI